MQKYGARVSMQREDQVKILSYKSMLAVSEKEKGHCGWNRVSQDKGEEGRADVCRILAVSILIVKMSDGSAKWGEGNIGWTCHSLLASS